jgi:hypothetical protein
MALAESLPNIKGLQRLYFTARVGFQSTIMALLLEGFRKKTSLAVVIIDGSGASVEFLQEIKGLGQRNRFTPLLKALDPLDASPPPGIWSRVLWPSLMSYFTFSATKASDPPDASPPLGIWSRALAKVATEPDVLFHVLRNRPKLVTRSVGGSKKRKRDDE